MGRWGHDGGGQGRGGRCGQGATEEVGRRGEATWGGVRPGCGGGGMAKEAGARRRGVATGYGFFSGVGGGKEMSERYRFHHFIRMGQMRSGERMQLGRNKWLEATWLGE